MEQVVFIAGMRTSGVVNAQSSPGRRAATSKRGNPRLGLSKILACPGRSRSQGTPAALKLLGLLLRGGFAPSLNINKREVTAPMGFVDSIWNTLCLKAGCKPPGHHRGAAAALSGLAFASPAAGSRGPPCTRTDAWGSGEGRAG